MKLKPLFLYPETPETLKRLSRTSHLFSPQRLMSLRPFFLPLVPWQDELRTCSYPGWLYNNLFLPIAIS